MNFWRKSLLAAAVLAASVGSASAQKTLKVVMHSDLKIVDPIWTTAYITRNHGYMIYDTLFAMDEKGEIKPQMVEKYRRERGQEDLHLHAARRPRLARRPAGHRGGLHRLDQALGRARCARSEADDLRRGDDGARCENLRGQAEGADRPVDLRARQAVLERALHDAEARRRDRPEHADLRLHRLRPVRVQARTNGSRATRRSTSSSTSTSRASEPASGLAGGKVVKVDRVEWLAISDHQQAVNALLAGEIDVIEAPPHDLLPLLKGDANVTLTTTNPLGNQYTLRPNHLQKPFDNPKVRQALLYALNQKDFLEATIGNAEYYKTCKAMFVCGTALASEKGMEGRLEVELQQGEGAAEGGRLRRHADRAAAFDRPAGADQPRAGGEVADGEGRLQGRHAVERLADGGGRRVKKDPASAGGWHAMLTSWVSADILNPVMAGFINAGCDKAVFGWPCDAEMEKLRDDFARATDPAKQKEIAEAVQVREAEVVTHIHLGQWYQPAAARKNVTGFLTAPAPVFWNVSKK